MTAYEKLVANSRERQLVSRTASVLGWDQQTYMPTDAAEFRAQQLAYLSGKAHELACLPEIEIWLQEATKEVRDDSIEAANVREWRFHYERAKRLPNELVERKSYASSTAKMAWAKAREENDFSSFEPHLEELVKLSREEAGCYGYTHELYEALLCGYERGADIHKITSTLDHLGSHLKGVVKSALEKSKDEVLDPLPGPFPIEQQKILNREIAESVGFDFARGRIDTTTHPFCSTLGPKDVRLTTRYELDDFTSSLFGVLHEAGHGLYEQNVDQDQTGLPCGNPVSLGIHESQSRLWENHLGRSEAFWEVWLPRAKELFPSLEAWDLDRFLSTINRPALSFIRVEADELTYDLHVLLRMRIERKLINGELRASQVPEAWNAEFEDLFGMKVEKDSDGCLQDIHWSMGAFGYFPTYSLGNLYAAQLFHHACQEEEIPAEIKKGNYLPLRDWMTKNVHQHGSRYLPGELLEVATGQDLSVQFYLSALNRRYSV